MAVNTRRRPLLALIAAAISFVWLYHNFKSPSSSLQSVRWIQRDPLNRWDALVAPTVTVTVEVPEPTPPLLMNDAPTRSFRDNLRPEVKYISGWATAGWNNQVMEYMNLIYLGIITERIPILPPFPRKKRHHDGVKIEELVPFSRIFDMSRMQDEAGVRVLEWGDVKDLTSDTMDPIGCWSLELGAWNATARSLRPLNLKLDISYTPTPGWVKLVPGDYKDQQATFWSLAALAFNDTRPANVDLNPQPAPSGSINWPDKQLLCFDNVYYICAHQPWEFDKQYSPAWRFVGRYMRYSSEMQDIADECIRKALDVEENEEIPPYIAVHVRHGDFKSGCVFRKLKPEDCLAPLSAYARRVEEVREEIFKTKGIRIADGDVIMTTDETDEDWWAEVLQLGWKRVDHVDVIARHGLWYPTFVDGVIQGSALGFVGTHKSTVSILAERRVLDWQKGVTRTVFWGTKGADDH